MRVSLVGMILGAVAGIALGQWEPDQRLTDDPADSYLCGQQCIVARGDTLHVIFVDNRTDTFSLYYTRSLDAGESWSAPFRLSPQTDGNVSGATLTASGEFVHVVWEISGYRIMKYRRSTDGGASWLAEESLVVSTRSCSSPFLSAAGQNVGLAWCDSRDGNWNGELYYKQSSDAGQHWTVDTRLTIDTDSVLDKEMCLVLAGTNRYLVWTRVGWNTSVNSVWFMRSTSNGTTWEPRTRVTSDPTAQNQPMVAVSGPNVHICWWDGRDGGYGIWYRGSTDNGQTWSAEQYLADTLYGSDYPALATAGRNVHIVYRAWSAGQFGIAYRSSTDNGQTWSAETTLTTVPGMGTANIAATGARAHVLFYDNREGNFEIYHKRNLAAGAVAELSSSTVQLPGRNSTIVRRTLNLPSASCSLQSPIALLDATGRKVLDLRPGPNDLSRLSPGIYFLDTPVADRRPATSKVIKLK